MYIYIYIHICICIYLTTPPSLTYICAVPGLPFTKTFSCSFLVDTSWRTTCGGSARNSASTWPRVRGWTRYIYIYITLPPSLTYARAPNTYSSSFLRAISSRTIFGESAVHNYLSIYPSISISIYIYICIFIYIN